MMALSLAKCHPGVNICSLSLLANSRLQGMSKEEAMEVMAKVLDTLPNAMFRVELEDSQHQVLGELSPYDLNRGRITTGMNSEII